jgi:hypothetical protein
MGCSVYGYAIIGLKVPWIKVCSHKRKVKTFDHNYPEDWVVDPKTGKQLWREEDGFIDRWEGEYAGEETLCDYEVVRDYEEPDFAIICLRKSETRDLLEGYCDPPVVGLPSTEAIKSFQEEMSVLGLWDPENFGLFAYGYASC